MNVQQNITSKWEVLKIFLKVLILGIKKVLNITPIKKNNNYRFGLGLQMFRMKTNEQYSLIVEVYNRDYITWERQEIYVNGTGMWVESHNTTKYQYHYGSSNTLCYSKTLIKFKKTSSSPIFVYFTVHFDDKGGDLNAYPKEFKNQIYLVAYGVEGLTDHVDSEVYDAHEAFEIDKIKMKMLVPLDMNNQKIMNVNYDLKFRDLFKVIKCHFKADRRQGFRTLLYKKNDNQILSFSNPVVLPARNLNKTIFFSESINFFGTSNNDKQLLIDKQCFSNNYKFNNHTSITMMLIFDSGINLIEL